MNWILSKMIAIVFEYLITPKNFRWAMGKAAKQLKKLAALTTFTDVDDKAVEIYIKTFHLEEESK